MPARKYKMDVMGRLQVYCNVCSQVYHVPAEIKSTHFGAPYVKVGGRGGVRIVIFARYHVVKIFFTPPHSDQIALTFPMDRAEGGKWMSNGFVERLCKLATSITVSLEAGEPINLI